MGGSAEEVPPGESLGETDPRVEKRLSDLKYTEGDGKFKEEELEQERFIEIKPIKHLLRATRQPTFDSEYVDASTSEMVFFQRQIGASFAVQCVASAPGKFKRAVLWLLRLLSFDLTWRKEVRCKTEGDTNICIPASLPFPFERTIESVRVQMEATFEQREEILRNATFSFEFSGCRKILEVPLREVDGKSHPLMAVRETINPRKTSSDDKVVVGNIDLSRLEKRVASLESVPTGHFRILPYEAFAARIKWANQPKLTTPVKITVFLEGDLYSPL